MIDTNSTSRPVLVLNASFEPIHVVSAKRAMTLVAKGAALVQESSKHFIHTARMRFPLPSVIRLLVYRRVPRYARAVSRKSIFLRDGHRCQYCLELCNPKQLTLDHVMPRSRGGRSTWENLTTCCYSCNNAKADRTPEEARMPLASKPKPFGMHAKHRQHANIAQNADWDKYLFV